MKEDCTNLMNPAVEVIAAWDATAGPEQAEWFPWLYDAIQKLRKAIAASVAEEDAPAKPGEGPA